MNSLATSLIVVAPHLPPPQSFSPCRHGTAETASPGDSYSTPGIASTALTTTTNPRNPPPSSQPFYPSPSLRELSSPDPDVRVTSPTTRWSRSLRHSLLGGGETAAFTSPFRSISRGRSRRSSAAWLWNPSNSTPRGPPSQQKKRERTPEPSAEERVIAFVPLKHPDLASPRSDSAIGGAHPLLTLPEQRQQRHSGSTKASLQVERSSGGSHCVSVPRSLSVEFARRKSSEGSLRLDKGKGKAIEEEREDTLRQLERSTTGSQNRGQTAASIVSAQGPGISFDKDRSKTDMLGDIERGPDALGAHENGGISNMPDNDPRNSFQSGMGPTMSDSTSIIGSDGPPTNPGEEWGPQHPCFPHVNPHVPLSSPLYQSTRIIRIRRDWMLEGDLAPTFSNLYPEILDPAGVSEHDFRKLVERVNKELISAFSPWSLRNIVDGLLGLITGWVWDDMGFTGVKMRLNKVEQYLEEWNQEMEGRSKEGLGIAPRVVPLRRTGYMNLDIQVPDPEISYPASTGGERTATNMSQSS